MAAPAAPILECGLESTNGLHVCQDGMVDLQWTKGESAETYELEEAVPGSPQEFHPRYSGSDLSSVRTGLAEGSHRFRVRAIDAAGTAGPWSETLVVKVTYMSHDRLILLLILGGCVVLATVSAITHGHFTHRKRQAP